MVGNSRDGSTQEKREGGGGGNNSNSLPTVTHDCKFYVSNCNNCERNGSEDVLSIPYYVSNCKTATNFW